MVIQVIFIYLEFNSVLNFLDVFIYSVLLVVHNLILCWIFQVLSVWKINLMSFGLGAFSHWIGSDFDSIPVAICYWKIPHSPQVIKRDKS